VSDKSDKEVEEREEIQKEEEEEEKEVEINVEEINVEGEEIEKEEIKEAPKEEVIKEEEEEEEEEKKREKVPPPAPAKPQPKAPPRKPLTREDIERIVEETVKEVFRKFFQPIATEVEEREAIKRRLEDIERSLGAIPTIERRITEEIRRLRRAEEVGAREEVGLPISLPEPKYKFYYDKWAVIKGYVRYGVYVSVDLDTNLALSRLVNMPEHYFWYLEYLGERGVVTDKDRIRATDIFGGNIVEIGNEVFVMNKQQPASPMQQSRLLSLPTLDSYLKSALDEHAFIDIRTETWVRRVLDVLYDGQRRLASMTDAEVEALARELSLEREKRFPGL
jgi:hypothetical protein